MFAMLYYDSGAGLYLPAAKPLLLCASCPAEADSTSTGPSLRISLEHKACIWIWSDS